MRILLSIKPEYAIKIFNGTKKYEFRKSIFKNREITHVVVYASNPVKQVIGEFEIDQILEDNVNDLWEKTKDESGISQTFFYSYFENRETAYAIKIKSFHKYTEPLSLKHFDLDFPPQSFVYI